MPAITAEPWDSAKTYYEGDVVSHKGYFYRRLKGTSASGEDPKTATYTVTFTADASGNKGQNTPSDTNLLPPVDKTMRVWTIADEGFSYHMARVRGLKADSLELIPNSTTPDKFSYLQFKDEYAMVCVRNMKAGYDEEDEFMIPPNNASYAGWGMPAGMSADFDDTDYDYDVGFFGEWVYGPGAGIYEYGAPKKYGWYASVGGLQGACFIPNTVLGALAPGTPDPEGAPNYQEYYSVPAFSNESFGSIFASMSSFSRSYDYANYEQTGTPPVTVIVSGGTFTTPSFADEWQNNPNWTGIEVKDIDQAGDDYAGTSGTDPDMNAE